MKNIRLKKLGVVFLSMFMLLYIQGCTAKNNNSSSSTKTNDEVIINELDAAEYTEIVQNADAIIMNYDTVYDFTDSETLYNRADVVVSGKFIKNAEVIKGIAPGEIMTVYTFKVEISYKGENVKNDMVEIAVPGGIIKRKDYISMWEAEADQFNLFVGKDGTDIRDMNGNENLVLNYGYNFSIDQGRNFLVYLREGDFEATGISKYILPYYNFSIREIKDGEVTSLTVDGTTADAFLESEIIPES